MTDTVPPVLAHPIEPDDAQRRRADDPADPRRRIGGLDMARAAAMLGMLVTHYVFLADRDGVAGTARASLDGRVMPLFMVLGGVGATLLVERRPDPDRNLLARAAILLSIGVALDQLDTGVMIVLQAYALFFALTPVFRRLSTGWLVGLGAAIAAIGSWTAQTMAAFPMSIEFADLNDPIHLLWAFAFSGGYPFFPAAAFFLLGMVLGRLRLDAPRAVTSMIAIGAAAWIVPVAVARAVERWTTIDVPDGPGGFVLGAASPPIFQPDRFEATDLLSTAGHGQMLGWVISAMGSSMVVIGLAILAARRFARLTRPAEIVGRFALTFYVAHVIPTAWYLPFDRTDGEQAAIAAAVWLGFVAAALGWFRVFGAGPLERTLRVGQARHRPPTVRR